jgi:hypothetical protein
MVALVINISVSPVQLIEPQEGSENENIHLRRRRIFPYRGLRVRMFYLQVEVTINNVLSTFLSIVTNAL